LGGHAGTGVGAPTRDGGSRPRPSRERLLGKAPSLSRLH